MTLLKTRARALFISDLHIGMPSARIDRLLHLLDEVDAEAIYLVGDILDGWRLSRRWHWCATYTAFLERMLQLSHGGVEVYYLPGNHDEFARQYLDRTIGTIRIVDRLLYRSARGQSYLVMHGDAFDGDVTPSPLPRLAGECGYRLGSAANALINPLRHAAGLPDWSVLAFARRWFPAAAAAVDRFEAAAVAAAREAGADGVICGHIHHAANHRRFGLHYINTGDWIDSCTAAVEMEDGTFRLIGHGPENTRTALEPEASWVTS